MKKNIADFIHVSHGLSHTMGITTDGSLWSWGYNRYGQLGLDDVTDRTSPALVGSDNDWAVITCGTFHTVGLKQDGTIWAWGDNDDGQLGLGDSKHAPIQVGNDNDWVSVSCGDFHTVGEKQDGSLWSWGTGEVNHPTTTVYIEETVPTKIS